MYYVLGILGLALLMIVHEGGHLLAARAFGMRVLRFSIGFGPTIWRYQKSESDTIYQVALIPFLAYVQVAGMNPFEDNDPEDKTSYANASLVARIVTIFAGPFANYLFASLLFFATLAVLGREVAGREIKVLPDGAAAAAKLLTGDRVVAIDGEAIDDFDDLARVVRANPEKELRFRVARGGQTVELPVTPRKRPEGGAGVIQVEPLTEVVSVPLSEAARVAIREPALVTYGTLSALGAMITGKEKAQISNFSGPIGLVKEAGAAAQRGARQLLGLLAFVSTGLAVFNLLPFPALDGGRLAFLGYEAITRRRPDAKFEVKVHLFGFAVLLVMFAVVTVFSDLRK